MDPGAVDHSMINVIEAHAGFVVDALKTMDARGLASVELRKDVEQRYNDDIQHCLLRRDERIRHHTPVAQRERRDWRAVDESE